MKRYMTTYSNGYTQESSSPHEAVNWNNIDDAQTFALSGKQVSAAEFYEAVHAAIQARLDKKSETHKRVRVLYGSSAASYVNIWVRK